MINQFCYLEYLVLGLFFINKETTYSEIDFLMKQAYANVTKNNLIIKKDALLAAKVIYFMQSIN